ncbi:flagellar hook-length control protein FliK [Primorskyibacter sp. 2E233]|uniref:flagellar hook-length control protein FliK n=1 Tax=Primorskyibacter sp. 2E233 TaxID=3413431 RepID=UPI003BF14855
MLTQLTGLFGFAPRAETADMTKSARQGSDFSSVFENLAEHDVEKDETSRGLPTEEENAEATVQVEEAEDGFRDEAADGAEADLESLNTPDGPKLFQDEATDPWSSTASANDLPVGRCVTDSQPFAHDWDATPIKVPENAVNSDLSTMFNRSDPSQGPVLETGRKPPFPTGTALNHARPSMASGDRQTMIDTPVRFSEKTAGQAMQALLTEVSEGGSEPPTLSDAPIAFTGSKSVFSGSEQTLSQKIASHSEGTAPIVTTGNTEIAQPGAKFVPGISQTNQTGVRVGQSGGTVEAEQEILGDAERAVTTARTPPSDFSIPDNGAADGPQAFLTQFGTHQRSSVIAEHKGSPNPLTVATSSTLEPQPSHRTEAITAGPESAPRFNGDSVGTLDGPSDILSGQTIAKHGTEANAHGSSKLKPVDFPIFLGSENSEKHDVRVSFTPGQSVTNDNKLGLDHPKMPASAPKLGDLANAKLDMFGKAAVEIASDPSVKDVASEIGIGPRRDRVAATPTFSAAPSLGDRAQSGFTAEPKEIQTGHLSGGEVRMATRNNELSENADPAQASDKAIEKPNAASTFLSAPTIGREQPASINPFKGNERSAQPEITSLPDRNRQTDRGLRIEESRTSMHPTSVPMRTPTPAQLAYPPAMRLAAAQVTNPSLMEPSDSSFDPEPVEFFAVTSGGEPRMQGLLNHGGDRGLNNARTHAEAVMRQVSDKLPRLAEGTIDIRLDPEELGKVRMRLITAEHGMTVHIQADRPETIDLLRRNVDQLARDLADAGFEASGFSFGDERAQNNSEDGEPDSNPVATKVASAEARQSPGIVDKNSPTAPIGGLDIRI